MKTWNIVKNLTIKQFSNEKIIKVLLSNRGLKTKKEIDEFLNPPNPQNIKPETLNIDTKELEKAVKRIKKAISDHESIVVYGDYDADGVCATAVLWETLNSIGAKVMPYIPHRVDEGYGLSEKGIDNVLHELDASLIITVDHGITAFDKIEYGKKLGIDFIICDHHVKPPKLPKAEAIIHTTQLCGAGVSWILAKELLSIIHNPSSIINLDLVAIATIADMVPLTGANRTLVKYGLKELNQTKRLGLKALIKEAGLKTGNLGVYDVSHLLAPRLNAMGRLEHAMDSLRLLCTKDEKRAGDLARLLNDTNKERQDLTSQTLLQAKNEHKQLTAVSKISEKLIFLSHESYNQGVIGLVAGKLVEEFYRPAIVVAVAEKYSKASARSVAGFNMIEFIRKASDFLVDCGGHPMAAGFTVETKNLKELQKKLEEIADLELDEEKLTRKLRIDCELNLDNLDLKLYKALQKLAPYGLGNPEPVFCSKSVLIKDARIVGSDGKHLKLSIIHHPSSIIISAVAFGMSDLMPKLKPEKPVDIAYSLSLNSWNNQEKLELKIKDVKV